LQLDLRIDRNRVRRVDPVALPEFSFPMLQAAPGL